ncbi:hypothetical protein BDB01DRAFT_854499 [Pilobolus umbonatus]|nr:hypothetical protein BDB01DRAFT_854499 [Pilobolus umbonatus]
MNCWSNVLSLRLSNPTRALWPLSAAIQPRWINSVYYKRLRIAADAQKFKLAELRRQAAASDPSSSAS